MLKVEKNENLSYSQKVIADRVIHEFIMTFWLVAICFFTSQMLPNGFTVFIPVTNVIQEMELKIPKFVGYNFGGAYNEVLQQCDQYKNRLAIIIIIIILLLFAD